MFYITKEPIIVHGYYTELIDDGCPSIGTYSTDRNLKVPTNTGLTVSKNGKITDIGMEIIMGASMFDGKFTVTDNISKFEDKVRTITEEEFHKVMAEKERREELKRVLERLDERLFIEEMNFEAVLDKIKEKQSYSEDEYEILSKELVNSALSCVSLYGKIAMTRITGGIRWQITESVNMINTAMESSTL